MQNVKFESALYLSGTDRLKIAQAVFLSTLHWKIYYFYFDPVSCQESFNLFKSHCQKRETRRERPKSAPYLRLKNIQGTTIGKIWKKNFFSKKNF